ncbi:hypothetical protein V2G26_012857 [Clonostachys chloroleuca]
MLARRLLLLSLYAEFGVCVQAQGSVCSSGIFPALKQTLGSHSEVLAYCQAHYPVAPETVFKRNAKSKCPPKPNPSTTTARQQPGAIVHCSTIYNKFDLSFIHGILFYIYNCRPIYNHSNDNILYIDLRGSPCGYCSCSTL